MKRALVAVALSGVLVGCERGTTGPASVLDAEEAVALATQFEALGSGVLDGLALVTLSAGHPSGSDGPREGTVHFTRTASCPEGGTVTVAGTATRSYDGTTSTLTVHLTSTKTHQACAFRARRQLVTLTGAPNVASEAHRKLVERKLSGPQTTTHAGAFAWTRGEESGTCDVDLTSVLDPDARTVTVTGSFCGREISRTRQWSPPGQG